MIGQTFMNVCLIKSGQIYKVWWSFKIMWNSLKICILSIGLWSAVYMGVGVAEDALGESAQNGSVRPVLRLAVTPSLDRSGFGAVLAKAADECNFDLKLLVTTEVQATELVNSGFVDALFMNASESTQALINAKATTFHFNIMFSDFLLVGPEDDPAGVSHSPNIRVALEAVRASGLPFISSGDGSELNKIESNQWRRLGKVEDQSPLWYREVGGDMIATLEFARELNGYSLANRASWLALEDKGDLEFLFGGDPELLEQYTYLIVSSDQHSWIKEDIASKLAGWLISDPGREAIADHRLDGVQVFSPQVPLHTG